HRSRSASRISWKRSGVWGIIFRCLCRALGERSRETAIVAGAPATRRAWGNPRPAGGDAQSLNSVSTLRFPRNRGPGSLSSGMQFDLTDLRLFVAVAEERKLTRAAARQHLSLAAASARVRGLEEQAGLPLLLREPRGMRLTPAGEAFLHHARAILRQVENLRADLQEYGGGLRGHLRIFANTTAVSDILPAILPRVLAGNPRINVEIQEKPNADIARGVLEGRADIGIVSSRVDTLGLEAVHFSTDQLVLATAAGHRFARRKRVEFAEVLDEDLIGMYA